MSVEFGCEVSHSCPDCTSYIGCVVTWNTVAVLGGASVRGGVIWAGDGRSGE